MAARRSKASVALAALVLLALPAPGAQAGLLEVTQRVSGLE